MSLYRQVWFNLEASLRLYKWLIPVLGVVLIGYTSAERLVIGVEATGLSVNAWDMVFLVFASNIYFASIIIVLPFTFIVGDLFSDSAMNTYLLLRSGSRHTWWAGKLPQLSCLALRIWRLWFLTL